MSEQLGKDRAERIPGHREAVQFPWEAVQLAQYKEHSKAHPERMPYVEKAIRTFFEQEQKNLNLFASKEMQAAFPYTVISVKDLAKAVYAAYGGRAPESKTNIDDTGTKQVEAPRSRKEFLFTSALETHHGNGFTFSEWTLREAMRALPAVLQATREGREPDDIQFYTLGFPTNEFGHMSPSFTDKMATDPFKHLGQLYAEFVKSTMQGGQPGHQSVTFKGISMGGAFAAEAAKVLLSDETVTQERTRDTRTSHSPHLSIAMYSPTGTDESVSYAQTGAGFIADTAVLLGTHAKARKVAFGEKEFFKQLKEYAAHRTDGRRMQTYMDDAQRKDKEKIIGIFGSIVQRLLHGVPVDPTLKVNKVTGVWDPTLFSFSRLREANKRRDVVVKRPGEGRGRRGLSGVDWVRGYRKLHPLSRHTLTRSEKGHREFGLRSSHNIQFFGSRTPTEMRRWDKIADMLRLIEVSA